MQPLVATVPLLAPPDLRPLAAEVFVTIARARFAAISSLLAVLGSSGLTGELLDAWVNAGLLHVGAAVTNPLEGTEVRYVALTPFGARELARTGAACVAGISAARLKRSSQKRAHDVAVGDFALAVMALGRDHTLDLSGLEADDKKFATSAVLEGAGQPPRRIALQADLYLVVRRPSGPAGLLIEVDRGTISADRMGEKYRAYLAWWRAGGPSRDFGMKAFRVLTVVPDDRRLAKLHEVALQANDLRRSGFLLFMKAEDATPADPLRLLAPVVRQLGDGAGRIPLFSAKV